MSAADDTPVSAAEAQSLFGPLSQFPVLILAVSGGPDSTALMVLAARWRKSLRRGPKLVAVTVDHALRKEAKHEALAVKRLARTLRVEHRTLRWSGRKPTSGIQEAARNARYRLLADAARKAGGAPVVTAHTRDDQAETVLLGLARGSGARSLAGMRASFDIFRRPLLGVARDDTVTACQVEGLEVWDDPHNSDPGYARVRVRTRVLPVLEEQIGPGVAAALARTAEQLRADADLLDELLEAARG